MQFKEFFYVKIIFLRHCNFLRSYLLMFGVISYAELKIVISKHEYMEGIYNSTKYFYLK